MFIEVQGKGKCEVAAGSSARAVAEVLNLKGPHEAVAVTINGELKDLSTVLKEGDALTFFDFESKVGKEVFWHTSAHVLAQAVLRLYPEATPTIGPPIEAGFYYDFANLEISDKDFEKIEKEIQNILKENYKPEKLLFKDRKEAIERFDHNKYKTELIEGFEEGPITAYSQGEFFDLCRGPHLPNLGKIKAFKILKTAGAYWRGDAKREMLTRIYAISFPDRKELQAYLLMLEEAKKRDHKILGPKLDLFMTKEEAPGMPFILPKGMIVWRNLMNFWKEMHEATGYLEIKTPMLMAKELWERSGHWFHYREHMYTLSIEEREFALKPMNCPGGMLYFGSKNHSYRELPLRVSEFGHVHRHEMSGSLSGLFRVRSFHQDDAHIFMRPADIKSEILGVLELMEKTYSAFGLTYKLELSTRPLKSMGSDEDWERATDGLKSALDEWDMPYAINEGDGAFYGPKIDFHIRDAIGRSWQCGTIQLDMALPEKFALEYTDQDGERKRPVMIHRAIFGSIERFFGILIEHFMGKFPLWLSPSHVRVLTVADRHLEYASEVAKKIKEAGFLVDVDESNESVSKKVREAQIAQINYMLTIGDKEVENKSINLRTRNNVVLGEVELTHFLERLKKEKGERSLTSLFE